jgi:hypothetical protein
MANRPWARPRSGNLQGRSKAEDPSPRSFLERSGREEPSDIYERSGEKSRGRRFVGEQRAHRFHIKAGMATR